MRVWNIVEKTIVYTVVVDTGFITTVSITADGNTVITGSYDGKISFFKFEVRSFRFLY